MIRLQPGCRSSISGSLLPLVPTDYTVRVTLDFGADAFISGESMMTSPTGTTFAGIAGNSFTYAILNSSQMDTARVWITGDAGKEVVLFVRGMDQADKKFDKRLVEVGVWFGMVTWYRVTWETYRTDG